MSYGKFESVAQVATIFDVEVKVAPLLHEVGKLDRGIEVPDYKIDEIIKLFGRKILFCTAITVPPF